MTGALELFWGNISSFMTWNLFLAIIPCALSFILFSKQSPKRLPSNPIWWFGLVIFILFLPNAPYIITDIIHFVDNVRATDVSDNGVIFVLIPQYIVFILLGFQCYVVSVLKLIKYLSWLRLIKNTTWLEVGINFICAIGVYWGRFNRLNSWDVFTNLKNVIRDAIHTFTSPNFFVGTILFFITFTGLYYIFKWINISLFFYWQNRSKQVSV
ncbi:MAG: DUF1361 domain-containing protein [Pseudanabaena sp.]|nr:MAG: DUF1361 domain-containing protein [Pseudanabaena sp.]